MSGRTDQPRVTLLGHDAHWLRRLAYWGARYGSTGFAKHGSVALGAFFSGILPGYRRIVRDNLRRIHGKRDTFQEQLDVTKTFVNFACCLTEALGIEKMALDSIEYQVLGSAILDALLDQTAGFIVATAHVGAWDSAATHLRHVSGRPVLIVMTREMNAAARRFHDSLRQRHGVEIAHVGQDSFEGLRLLKHVRNGGIVAVQLDRTPEASRSVPALLFNQRFDVPRGLFQLAGLASVPIVPVFCARVGYYRYEVHLYPPIRVGRRATEAQLAAAAAAAAQALEEFLRHYPTQWFHFERAKGRASLRKVGQDLER